MQAIFDDIQIKSITQIIEELTLLKEDRVELVDPLLDNDGLRLRVVHLAVNPPESLPFGKTSLSLKLLDLLCYLVSLEVELNEFSVVLLGVINERLDPLAVDESPQVHRHVADKDLGELCFENARSLVLVVEGQFKEEGAQHQKVEWNGQREKGRQQTGSLFQQRNARADRLTVNHAQNSHQEELEQLVTEHAKEKLLVVHGIHHRLVEEKVHDVHDRILGNVDSQKHQTSQVELLVEQRSYGCKCEGREAVHVRPQIFKAALAQAET